MKKLCLLLLSLFFASAFLASDRDWKPARVIDASETDVTGQMHGQSTTMHYTFETESMLYFADFSYKPTTHGNSRPPDIAVNVMTKIAVEGKHVYVLDANGKEVKLHIVKKTPK